jgi:hypothetical protein
MRTGRLDVAKVVHLEILDRISGMQTATVTLSSSLRRLAA